MSFYMPRGQSSSGGSTDLLLQQILQELVLIRQATQQTALNTAGGFTPGDAPAGAITTSTGGYILTSSGQYITIS